MPILSHTLKAWTEYQIILQKLGRTCFPKCSVKSFSVTSIGQWALSNDHPVIAEHLPHAWNIVGAGNTMLLGEGIN